MLKNIIFESHATSEDNEKKIASGHLDSPLSDTGKRQALELGKRYATSLPDIILCSDLQRSYMTAELAFPKTPHIRSKELREWDYGIYNGKRSDEVARLKALHIFDSFEGGESLDTVVKRIARFLKSQLKLFLHQRIMLIGHRSAFYTLEHLSNKNPLEALPTTPWTWQPGRMYKVQII